MTKKKQKKPTLNEVKQVVGNLIHDLQTVNNKVDALALVLNGYVEYRDDDKKFLEYLKKKQEKANDKQGTTAKDSK